VARQTGKSFKWGSSAIELALQKKNARIRYGTAFQTDLEEFIIPIFNTILADCPADVLPKYKKQGSKWVFPSTGSEIKFIGLDKNPDGIRGNALDLIIIDEAGFVENLDYLYRSVIIPMRRHRPNLKVVMSSTPSETPDHEFKDYCQKAILEGGYFKATIHDDETCTEAVKAALLEECGGVDSTNWRREFLCEFVVDEDLAIIPEWNDDYIRAIEPDDFYQYYHKYVAQDIGGTKVTADFTAHLYGYYDFQKATLVIEDESQIRGPMSTTDNIAEMVREKEKALWGDASVYRRISDNNNPILLNDLGIKHDIHFMPTDKDELPAMVNDCRLLVKSGRLAVHPRCKHTIGCFKNGIYNSRKIKREFSRSKVLGHYDHLAAGIYLVRNLDEFTNPIPSDLGVSYASHHIRPEAKPAHELSKIMGKQFKRN